MKLHLLPVLLAFAVLTATAAAVDQVAVGDTAQLTQGTVKYTGILVKRNTLAPCDAKSSADDIVFDPQKDTIVSWPKPCSKLPRFVNNNVITTFLKGNMDLMKAVDATKTVGV